MVGSNSRDSVQSEMNQLVGARIDCWMYPLVVWWWESSRKVVLDWNDESQKREVIE